MRALSKALLLLSVSLIPFQAQAGEDFTAALKEGKVSADIRARYEYADRAGLKVGTAETLRTRLGYMTGDYYNFAAKLEVENIWAPFGEDYDDGANRKTRFTRIADPELTEVNEAFLQYQAYDSLLRGGRQVVKLDDRFFVGDSDWRQNQTSYDAVRAETSALPHLKATYVYVWNERNNLGTEADDGIRKSNSHLLNASTDLVPFSTLRGYVYHIDLEDEAPKLSSTTIGFDIDSKYKLNDDWTFTGLATFANQRDAAKNPDNYNLNFYRLVGGTKFQGATVMMGYEVFEGNGTSSFTRPFGNNHRPQGRSDIISTKSTIANGLEDAWGRVEYQLDGVHSLIDGLTAGAEYHDFSAEHTDSDYGSEYNLYLTQNFGENYAAEILYADYDADNLSFDTQKLIFQVSAKF